MTSGKMFCSRICVDTARRSEHGIIKAPNYKDGRSSYARIAAQNYDPICVLCRCPIRAVLEVHHLDHNRLNNVVSNLMFLCVICHSLETFKLIKIYKNRKVKILDESCRCDIEKIWQTHWR